MNREKALDKIAKLRALAASPVPAEAAAALRQMYKLMEQFAIDDEESNMIRIEEVIIELYGKTFSAWEGGLAAMVGRKFGVGVFARKNVIIGASEGIQGSIGSQIVFFGPAHRQLGAEYAYSYLRRCGFAAREEFQRSLAPEERRRTSNAESFMLGFVSTCGRALDEIAPTVEEVKALETHAERYRLRKGKTSFARNASYYGEGARAGEGVRGLKHGVNASGPRRAIGG